MTGRDWLLILNFIRRIIGGRAPGIEESCFIALIKRRQSKPKNAEESAGKEWADKLRQTFNTSGEEKIQVEQGIFADGDNKYIDKLVFKKGDFDPLMSYPFTIVVGEK